MNLMTRSGARVLALGLASLIGLAGCQSYDAADTNDAAASSGGETFRQGYDRGMRHTAPYAATHRDRAPAAEEPRREEARPAPRRASTVCAPAPMSGYSVSGLAFPTGDAASSAIMVHQSMPNEVSLNQEFEYWYHLCNLTDGTLQNVVLTVENTENLRIVSSDPAATSGGARTMWALGDLGPRESTEIHVRAVANAVGMASNCITVSYNNVLCAQTRVVQPALSITKTATESALLCDDIVYTIEVRNNGTGTARNVRLRDTFPAGVTAGGQTSIDEAIGDLAAGEGKKITINARADRTGSFNNTATAVADGGLTASSSTVTTVVSQPSLEITSDCTGESFIGRNFTHSYTIRNTGDTECDDTRVVVQLPGGAQFVRASSEGVAQGGSVVFDLGSVPAGAQRTVSVTMLGSDAGTYSTTATASCTCAEAVTQSCSTPMRGIPALLLEVIDVDDPDEVGTTEEYIITVTNQGSAPATGIRITATIPQEMEYVSSSGASAGSVNGRVVTFAPFGPLAPKAKATWVVVTRAIAPGDVRFAVEMISDQLTSPVNETESTFLYE